VFSHPGRPEHTTIHGTDSPKKKTAKTLGSGLNDWSESAQPSGVSDNLNCFAAFRDEVNRGLKVLPP
jgi:hypothetical protein